MSMNMSGKFCVVTGATSGIGRAAALALGRAGADVVLIGRNEARGERAVRAIAKQPGARHAEFLRCDLSSLRQTRELAARLLAKNRPIDVLINNAGAKFDEYSESEDGIEMTFAANHLGHFLLTALLHGRLAAASAARIVNVSGENHRQADDLFEPALLREGFDRRKAACRAKLANLLFTLELARRTAGSPVTVNAVHPGCVATRVNLNNGIWPWIRHLGAHLLHRNLISARRGADTVVFLATSPEVNGITGGYWYQRQPLPCSPLAQDVTAARRLWHLSLRLSMLDETAGPGWAVWRD